MPTEAALMEPRDNGFTFLCVDQTASGVLCSEFFPKKRSKSNCHDEVSRNQEGQKN